MNWIIEQRIEKLERIKKEMLTVKKSERGDLKELDNALSRLKRWRRGLMMQQASNALKNASNNSLEAMQKFKNALNGINIALNKQPGLKNLAKELNIEPNQYHNDAVDAVSRTIQEIHDYKIKRQSQQQ